MEQINKNLAMFILRMSGLFLAFGHGWGKLSGMATGQSFLVEMIAALGVPLPGIFAWIVTLTEFAGGLLIAVGLFTRMAAAFASVNLLVAVFLQHKVIYSLLFSLGLLSASQQEVSRWGSPELAFIYLFIFLAILLMGPGEYSLSKYLEKKKSKRPLAQ